MYELEDGSGQRYKVDSQGCIYAPNKLNPSGEWKALALVRRNNFGSIIAITLFAHWSWALPTDWLYKNGKPKFTLRDLDHGTVREWGTRVRRVVKV